MWVQLNFTAMPAFRLSGARRASLPRAERARPNLTRLEEPQQTRVDEESGISSVPAQNSKTSAAQNPRPRPAALELLGRRNSGGQEAADTSKTSSSGGPAADQHRHY